MPQTSGRFFDELGKLLTDAAGAAEGVRKEIEAVVFFKQIEGDQYRVSMRSKGDIDVGGVAKSFGGGGHKNAAGCTVDGAIDALQKLFLEKIEAAIDGRPAGR